MSITIRARTPPTTDAVGGPPLRAKSFWGAEVRRIRREQRMSQRRLARLAGVDRSCLLRFENGESRGNIDLIERLLGVLGYELDMMWRGFVVGEPDADAEPEAEREGEPQPEPEAEREGEPQPQPEREPEAEREPQAGPGPGPGPALAPGPALTRGPAAAGRAASPAVAPAQPR